MNKFSRPFLACLVAALVNTAPPLAAPAGQTLEQGFLQPPPQAYPGGDLHISTDEKAVKAQLEAQRTLGLNKLAVGSNGAPGIYLSEQWRDSIAATLRAASALDFDVTFLSSPGFSHTGDSHVQPQEAMKKLVWSETLVQGGKQFKGRLAPPPHNSGPYQNIPYFNESPWTIAIDRDFYRDIAVMAFPVKSEVIAAPRVTSSNGPIDAARFAANDPRDPLTLESKDGDAPWLQLEFDAPQTVRSAVLTTPETLFEGSVLAELSAKTAEGSYQKVATFDMRSTAQVTRSFAPVRSTSFRMTFSRLPMNVEPLIPKGGSDIVANMKGLPFGPKRPLTMFAISAFSLGADARVNEAERKAGFFTFVNDYYALATDPQAVATAVPQSAVIDLTAHMRDDGTLDWKPPAGQWRVLRLGYSLTGKINHPAPPDATGLEVDKLDAKAMTGYLNRYLDGILPAGEERKAVTILFADSIESGPQNWTDNLFAEFQKRRGYDMRPFLPAITGTVIGSAVETDKFLWDFRQTIADLIHENTYAKLSELTHARGVKVRVQALEQARHQLGDDLEMRRYADEPMGALWASADPVSDYLREYPNQVADLRGAASAAHLYGRRVAASESGTTLSYPGALSPRVLKQIVDMQFAQGINWLSRAAPGPGDLWAPYAGDWIRYLARTSWLLQQGRYVADVAYFYGQEAPLVTLRERLHDVPAQYGFDFINAPALLDLVSMRDGRLVTASGMEYRVLQLGGNSSMMTLSVLRRLHELVESGLIVAGAAPVDSPSLADDPAEFRRLRDQLWGSDGTGSKLGKGRVYGTGSVAQALAAEGIAPDIQAHHIHVYQGTIGDTLLFQHRRTDEGDFYFIINRSGRAEPIEFSFRQVGRAPELWRADTGERQPLSYRIENGRTHVIVDTRINDAMFIVFRNAASGSQHSIPAPKAKTIATLDDWTVTLNSKQAAAPASMTMKTGSWSESTDPHVRYFSGTADYSRTIDLPAAARNKNARTVLRLGEVQDIAQVSVNGTVVGVRWTPPYDFDVTQALKPGTNRIDVKVTNRPVNSLIGAAHTKAVSPNPFASYRSDAALRPSGLIGPVTLVREE